MAVATVKLFHEDPYLTRFTAQVVSCTQQGASWDVVLDRTAFYAEAGGQPSDQGTLGGRQVLSVREDEDGTITHTVDAPLSGEVQGEIDWLQRLDHMEQHTGQHLLSGAFEQLFDAETVSWHLGADSCTVDLGIEGLSSEQIDRIEEECNRVIRAGLPVVTHLVDQDGVAKLPLRKPPTVTENIRVVEISGYDWSACAGTHVRNTGELGLLKVKAWEKNKKSTRVYFLVGRRALQDYAQLDRMTRDLCRGLSMAVSDLPKFVERAQAESSSLRKQVKVLQEQLLEIEAERLLSEARRIGGARILRMVIGARPLDEVKLLAAKVAAHPQTIAVFGTKGALPNIVLYRSLDLRLDVGAIIKQVLPMIDGRGGGSPVQAQGGGTRPEMLEQALDTLIQRIAELLHQA